MFLVSNVLMMHAKKKKKKNVPFALPQNRAIIPLSIGWSMEIPLVSIDTVYSGY